jgi:methyltransferase
LTKYPKSNIILTSRFSNYFKNDSPFSNNLKKNGMFNNNSILIVFGSPKFGLKEIFSREKINVSNYNSFNFFPYQGTQTVRLEESIFGVLSVINHFIHS